MKAWAGRLCAFGPMLDCQLVSASGNAITDRLVWFIGLEIFLDTDIADRPEGSIVEPGGAQDIADAQ